MIKPGLPPFNDKLHAITERIRRAISKESSQSSQSTNEFIADLAAKIFFNRNLLKKDVAWEWSQKLKYAMN